MRRAWWVLLLLAAVFAAHGADCAGSDTAGSHAAPAASSAPFDDDALHSPAGTAPADGHGHPGDAPDAPPVAVGAVVDTSTPGPAEHGSHGGGLLGHLMAACLAVLALSLRTVLRRTRSTLLRVAAAARAVPVRVARVRLPRPPDLHTLCVLRT